MSGSLLIEEHHKNHPVWGKLCGAALPLSLAEFCQTEDGVKVIIAPDHLSAQQLKDELTFFLSASNQNEMLFFPDWETLPYDQFSPHEDLISDRLYCLNRLNQTKHAIVITAASTLQHRLCPPTYLDQQVLILEQKQYFEIDAFRQKLQHAGYHHVNKVLEHGEYAIRGSIIDVYPMGSKNPVRIELFDDEIESLRYFDPETQRTVEKIAKLHILPAREFPLNDESITLFRRSFREHFTGNPSQCPIYESVSNKQYPSGIEYYLPLFFEQTATFFDYLPDRAKICLVESIHDLVNTFWDEVQSRYEQRSYDVSRPILKPEIGFIDPIEFFTALKPFKPLKLTHSLTEKKQGFNFNINKAPSLPVDRKKPKPLESLSNYVRQPTQKSLLVVESAGRREVILELLNTDDIKPKPVESWEQFLQINDSFAITTGPLIYGAEIPDESIAIIVESQLFGEIATPQKQSRQKSIDPDLIIRDLAELSIGAPVVHLEFGVGRYQGLKTIESGGTVNEFLMLTYANNDIVYVPVTSLHVISRYTGSDSDHAPLHKLGTEQWQKAKKKAAEKIHDVAIELLEIYAKREAKPGFEYLYAADDYQRFASGFPFTETDDQTRAIEQIKDDMTQARPMDRLICGDVGFGKTEVAMRAAFIAVQNSKQVCVLVPTTLLAGQHHENFRDRFADFPINIELLSRFRSGKEMEKVLDALHKGTVDIVIGTHKLFQKDVRFKDLGLLIIDEEHRFGVKQKEYIKSLRTNVDILSMTATPIPRTLNMAMSGIRDISLITTPPAKRLAIKTFWQERNDSILREAILREILRGGQVFFLHNNVQTIERISQELTNLVPEAKVNIAHGQMKERELERIMSDFYHHRFNVLVCTTIIETGIDIPTANTIIIDRADKFGLAQLHQLRGRVGRSHHQAYAYLLTPNEKLLTADAKKRLEAIVSLEDLGAGFTLATHDLEIRGAGELLGEEQSGNMHAIGFSLFMEMLDKAVSDLKSGKTPELTTPTHQGPDIDLRVSAIIPESYIGDVHTRLIMYKRISNAKDRDELKELQIEIIDRFGLLPKEVKLLFLTVELKMMAQTMGVEKIAASGEHINIYFEEKPSINTAELIRLIQTEPQEYQMKGPSRLSVIFPQQSSEEKIHKVQTVLKQLQVV